MNATPARWLSVGVVGLVVAASATGLWVDGLYRDPDSLIAMFRAYDLVTLVVVAPLLAATLVPALAHRPRVRLLRVSLLAYCIYTYAYYVFGAQYNAVLLLHVAIFATSLSALVASLGHREVARLGSSFTARTPARTVAAVLVILGCALAVMWTIAALNFAVRGVVPGDPSVLVVPPALTRLGAVLDMSLLVPAYIVAGILLWRRRAWGFVIATIVLVSGTLHQVGYAAAMVFQDRAGIPGASYDAAEPIIFGLFAAGATLLLANVAPHHGPSRLSEGPGTRGEVQGEPRLTSTR